MIYTPQMQAYMSAAQNAANSSLTPRQQQRADYLRSQGRQVLNQFRGGGSLGNDQLTPPTQPTGTTPLSQGPAGRLNRIADDRSRRQAKDDRATSNFNANQDVRYGNLGSQTGPLGDTRTIGYNDKGELVMKTEFGQGQQGIYDAENAFTLAARNAASSQMGQLGGPFSFDAQAERARLEDQAYGKLTRDLETDYQRGRSELESSLRNKGYSIESPYAAQEMQRYDQNYERTKQEARQTAAEMGGNELTRSFGVASGTRNQNLNDINMLSSMGPGLRSSEFQGFTPIDYGNLPFPSQNQIANRSADQADKSLGLQQQQIDLAKKAQAFAESQAGKGSEEDVFVGAARAAVNKMRRGRNGR